MDSVEADNTITNYEPFRRAWPINDTIVARIVRDLVECGGDFSAHQCKTPDFKSTLSSIIQRMVEILNSSLSRTALSEFALFI